MKNNRLFIFLEFLIGGIILGIIEDIILIKFITNEPITLFILLIIFLVTLPFAFLGEYVVDRIDFLKLFNLNKKYKNLEVFLEFLIFGVVLGVAEDLIAFSLAIGDAITLKIVLTAFIIAVPFAFVGEYLLDRISLQKTFSLKRLTWKNNHKKHN